MLKKNDSSAPLRVMFLLTSMPIGGAETLLVNLVRRIDRNRISPLVACMKHKDVLGNILTEEIPVFENLIRHKYDFAVLGRLKKLFLEQQIDALITVGAGDKMFWGRLAARRARVPVILSALHSTGWPDGVGKLNRMLTGITDGFIAVAAQHADYQREQEKFPAEKVFMIPNGIDTETFVLDTNARQRWRKELSLAPEAPVVGIVAALRPEKNHELFLESARRVAKKVPEARFVIAGDGPQRSLLERLVEDKGLTKQVIFLGSTQDIPGVLSMLDLFALTSHNEASPVSILEALACQRPVVATDVGSIDESVISGKTGFLVAPDDPEQMADRWLELLGNPALRQQMGEQGRRHVMERSSLSSMTAGYMELVEDLYDRKTARPGSLANGCVSWDFRTLN